MSDVGRVRRANEDACRVEPEIGLFVVSDGMGGHAGGRLASTIVTEDLPVMIENKLHTLRAAAPRAVRRVFKATVAEQSRQLRLEALGGEHGYTEMGATVIVLLIKDARAYIANLGDSRIYRLRNGKLRQLTRDHSVVSELLETGAIDLHEAADHEAQGQITRYLGMDHKAAVPHVKTFALRKADRLLLCTDGLTDMLGDRAVRDILMSVDRPDEACRDLIDAANAAGGHDNITAVVIDYTRADPRVAANRTCVSSPPRPQPTKQSPPPAPAQAAAPADPPPPAPPSGSH